MGRPLTLYDSDPTAWAEQQAAALRRAAEARVNLDLDLEHLAEELEDMVHGQKAAVESNLTVVLLHLLKYEFQPAERSGSWRRSIAEHRNRLHRAFARSSNLRRHAEAEFASLYEDVVREAVAETGLPATTFPEACPYGFEQALDHGFWPGERAHPDG